MKKKVLPISLILVVACAIVAMYWYVDRMDKKEKAGVMTDTEKLLLWNPESDYPPTPYSVAELYCKIVECTYSPSTTEEQLSQLVAMERKLFDPEFQAINSESALLTALKEELSAAKEKKTVFTGYVIDKASNTERYQIDGKDYASLQLQFVIRTKDGSGTADRTVILRKDIEGRYKILGWKSLE